MSKYSQARSQCAESSAVTSYSEDMFDDAPPQNLQYRPPNSNNGNPNNNGSNQSHTNPNSNPNSNSNANPNNSNSNHYQNDVIYAPSKGFRQTDPNPNKSRIPPPSSVRSSHDNHSSNPTRYNQYKPSEYNPTQYNSQSNTNNNRGSSNPTQYNHNQSNHNHNANPPQSRSSEHHQSFHDYPEYMQHKLSKEDEKQREKPQRNHYAHSEQPQNNYQYQQRHNQFGGNANHGNSHQNTRNHNQNQNNGHARSEQAHYRGNNKARSEMTAAPYSLQAVSQRLPKRPEQPYQVKQPHKDLFPIRLKSNSTRIHFHCEVIIKYDIEFDPPVAEDAKIMRGKAIKECTNQIQQIYGSFFNDNTRVYAENHVRGSNTFNYGNGKKIVLKFGQKLKVMELDLQYKKQIQGIFLQSLIRKADLRRFGRGHFDMNKQARLPIQGLSNKFPKNLSLLPGYRTSLETTVSGLMIGIDTVHRLIEDRTVQELLDSYRVDVESQHPNDDRDFVQKRYEDFCQDRLKQRHVQLFTNGKLYRIDAIDFQLTIHSNIPNNNVTIKDHWNDLYGVDLRVETPGIIVHYSKLKKNERTQQIQFIPPEICCLTGVSSDHRNQRSVTTGISKATKIPAYHRMKSTNKLVEKFQKIATQDHDLRKYVQIPKNTTEEIDSFVLQCPTILLKENSSTSLVTGPEMLQFDWKKCTFIEKGDKISEWAIVFGHNEQDHVDGFLHSLKQYADEGGFGKAVDESRCQRIYVANNDKWTWAKVLNKEIERINENNRRNGSGKKIQCVVAILPSHPQRICDRVYAEIKDICSTKKAILSQCILAKHTSKNHVINGVLRQLLVKLGSIPWKIRFDLPFGKLNVQKMPTMIIGINVNHAQKCNASAVGFAASFDRDFVRYFSRVIHQKQGTECIATSDLVPVIEQALTNFYKINHCFPMQIICYRDGISETQIEECVNQELSAFRQALSKNVNYKNIKLEFIAVQKRVNARFLISDNLQSAPPGTAINDVVVSNQFWDFYLVPSKPPPKCVAIPTRCIMICDDLRLSDSSEGEMDLMHFTNSLCTLYFNWPGPTRVPAPIKYAQKIAQQYCQTLPQKHPHHLLYNSYHFL